MTGWKHTEEAKIKIGLAAKGHAIACQECNCSKNNKTEEEFRRIT